MFDVYKIIYQIKFILFLILIFYTTKAFSSEWITEWKYICEETHKVGIKDLPGGKVNIINSRDLDKFIFEKKVYDKNIEIIWLDGKKFGNNLSDILTCKKGGLSTNCKSDSLLRTFAFTGDYFSHSLSIPRVSSSQLLQSISYTSIGKCYKL